MKYGANEEWDKHRRSTAPPEHQGGQLEKRVLFGIVLTLGGLMLALEKACDADNSHDKKSIEYVQVDYQFPEPENDYSQTPVPDRSPAHVPLDFIIAFAPEAQ